MDWRVLTWDKMVAFVYFGAVSFVFVGLCAASHPEVSVQPTSQLVICRNNPKFNRILHTTDCIIKILQSI